MRRSRHGKIVATVGPATAASEKLRALYLSGADTFRLNFSHGTHDDHARAHGLIRALEKEFGRPIGVQGDLTQQPQDPCLEAALAASARER